MEKLYKYSCLCIAVLLLAALIVTVIVGVTGVSPTACRVGQITVIVCLALLTVLTIFAIFLINVGGSLPHKIGHYLMHAGAVLLLVGFIFTMFTSATNSRVYVDADNHETSLDGDYYRLDTPVEHISLGRMEFVPKDCYFVLTSVSIKTYEDGTPHYYGATVSLCSKDSGLALQSATLSVNHPKYINGCKIYLMSIQNGGAVILIKNNPGEFPVLIGIAALVLGTFLSCFTGLARKRREGKDGAA